MADYIPSSDAQFNIWQDNLVEITSNNMTIWGIPNDDITALQGRQTSWTTAFSKANNKQNRTSADVQFKDDARKVYEKDLRGFIAQWLANNAKVSNGDRGRMGLTVKDGIRTPATIPASSPLGSIDFSVRMQHTISFADIATPRSKAKPEGVHGCEIWMKTGGEAPKDAAELNYVTTNTRTPYVLSFEGVDAGKTVWYWLRWVNTRGEHGPWGSPISAMVVG